MTTNRPFPRPRGSRFRGRRNDARRPGAALGIVLLLLVGYGTLAGGGVSAPPSAPTSVSVGTAPPVPWTCHGLRALATAACGNAPSAPARLSVESMGGSVRPLLTFPPAQAPYDFEMAYDSSDGYLVLLGVTVGSTPASGTDMWTFQGGVWQSLHPNPLPSNCPGSSLTYDDHDGYLLYFAGPSTPWVPCPAGNQTWTYHAGQWTQLFPLVSPSGRYGAAVTNDSADGYVLLFGGMSSGCAPTDQCNDTWKFASGAWTQLHPLLSPSVRQESGMTFDGADRYVLLFGGVGPNYRPGLNDTWAFSAGNWLQLHPTVSPPWPEPDALSYDAADRVAVFTSAWNSSSSIGEVVWTYGGGNWSRFTAAAPPERLGVATAFDWADGYLLFFGGFAIGNWQDTWTFQGGVWTNITGVIPALVILSFTALPSNVTIDHVAILTVSASGGVPPYSYVYSGLPTGCLSANNSTLACQPNATGRFAIVVTVTDSAGQAVLSTLLEAVQPEPLVIQGFSADPSSVVVNQTVTFSMSVLGGVPPFTFAYSGLPPGCVSSNASSLTCRALGLGTYQVTVEVADSFGLTASAATPLTVHLPVLVIPPPRAPAFAFDWFVLTLLVVGLGAIAVLGMAAVLVLNQRPGRPPPF